MKKFITLYGLPAVLIIILDQWTKWLAESFWQQGKEVTDFLSFQLTINKGISWGLLQKAGVYHGFFIAITGLISLLTLGLMIYAFRRYRAGFPIYGESFVIAGSISNLIDRCLYFGVRDFIAVHIGTFAWPVFNVADMFIVLGVGLMFIQQFSSEPSSG